MEAGTGTRDQPPKPLPDGDVYPVAGPPRWSELIQQHADARPEPERRERQR
ncbi:MAG TPA: hypothetical protein VIL37_15910 [Natronosporangium sp.]